MSLPGNTGHCYDNHSCNPFVLLTLAALEGHPTHILMGGAGGAGYIELISLIISVREGKRSCELLLSESAR